MNGLTAEVKKVLLLLTFFIISIFHFFFKEIYHELNSVVKISATFKIGIIYRHFPLVSLLTRFHCNFSSVLKGHCSLQVIISFRIGWRRSYSSSTRCYQSTISSGQLIGPYAELRCVYSPCYGRVGLLYFKCTDFSVREDWTTGTNSFQYTFVTPGSSAPYYRLRYHLYCFMQCADYTRGLIGR